MSGAEPLRALHRGHSPCHTDHTRLQICIHDMDIYALFVLLLQDCESLYSTENHENANATGPEQFLSPLQISLNTMSGYTPWMRHQFITAQHPPTHTHTDSLSVRFLLY